MEHEAFVARVLSRLPATASSFVADSWAHGGRPTKEGFGVLPIAGLDPGKAIDAVMDVDHYAGNIDHVAICRAQADPRFQPPDAVRFYQKLDLPLLGSIHHVLVLFRLGERQGWQVAAWDVLGPETTALSTKDGFRSDYNHGAWFARPGLLAYALGSAPRREDVGFLKWKALTAGADVASAQVLRANIDAMGRWASRR